MCVLREAVQKNFNSHSSHLLHLLNNFSFQTEAEQKVMERCCQQWVPMQWETNIGLRQENTDMDMENMDKDMNMENKDMEMDIGLLFAGKEREGHFQGKKTLKTALGMLVTDVLDRRGFWFELKPGNPFQVNILPQIVGLIEIVCDGTTIPIFRA